MQEPTTESTPPSKDTPAKPKSKLIPTAIALLLLISFSLTTYFAFKYFQLKQQLTQTPPPTSQIPPEVSNLTADWKTYTDSEYNFSIQYPPGWQTERKCMGGRIEDDYICFLSPDFEFSPGPNYVEKGGYITIGSKDGSLGFGMTTSGFCESTPVSGTYECREILIGDSKGIQRTLPDYSIFTDRGILKDGKIILTFRANYTSESEDNILKTFDQILSTLKFLDDETVSWKTYINKKVGFSLKYPSSWFLKKITESREPFNIEEVAITNMDMTSYISKEVQSSFIRVNILIKKTDQSITNYLKEHAHFEQKYHEENVTLSNAKGTKIKYEGLGKNIMIAIKLEGYIISFNTSDNLESENILNQILSTFKFIDNTYRISGSFSKNATQKATQNFAEKLNAIGAKAAILESYPLQFNITDIPLESCQAIEKTVSDLEYIEVNSGCTPFYTTEDPNKPISNKD